MRRIASHIFLAVLALAVLPLIAQNALDARDLKLVRNYEHAFQLENAREALVGASHDPAIQNLLQRSLGVPDQPYRSFQDAAHRYKLREEQRRAKIRDLAERGLADRIDTDYSSNSAADRMQQVSGRLDVLTLRDIEALHREVGDADFEKLSQSVGALVEHSLTRRVEDTNNKNTPNTPGESSRPVTNVSTPTRPHGPKLGAMFASSPGTTDPCAAAGSTGTCYVCDPMEQIDCGLDGGPNTIAQPVDSGGGGGTPLGDNTPVLEGIDPSLWLSGQTTQVTFTGEYFGTNAPTLTFSPGGGISATVVNFSDTQIVATLNVAPGTPTEDVEVTVTNNGYGNAAFNGQSGNSPTGNPVHARVQAPTPSPEVTVIGWVNGSAPDLVQMVSAGPTTASLAAALNVAGSCSLLLARWATLNPDGLNTPQDRNYAAAWLLSHSGNTSPPQYISPEVQRQLGQFRLLNDFGNNKSITQVGKTPFPCTTLLESWTGSSPEVSPYLGKTGTVNGNTYQLAEGRLGAAGQVINSLLTLNSTPWIWSVVELDQAGNASWSDRSMFPTFTVYVNGAAVALVPQSAADSFSSMGAAYQRTPDQIQ